MPIGPHGPLEQRSYADGKLLTRAETEYGTHGRETASRFYDGSGKLLSHSTHRYDEHGRMVEVKLVAEGRLEFHQRWRYGPPQRTEGADLAAVEWLDAMGNVVRSVAFDNGTLTSYWQHPDWRHPATFGFDYDGKRGVDYHFQADGGVLTAKTYYPRGSGNLERGEVRDQDGNLMEKVAVRYEARDHYGNWTSRVLSVWDPKTGEMLDIRRDTRVFTYF